MNISFKKCFLIFLTSLIVIHSHAQTFPNKPITIVAPFAPGGNVDIVARAVAQGLSTVLGQSVLVDNRAGAGGSIGSASVSRAEPDGYTLLLATTNTISVLPYMMKSPPYKPSSFTPIGLAAVSPLVMVVRSDDKRFQDANALIALAKKEPNRISVGHSGLGTSNHVAILAVLSKERDPSIPQVPSIFEVTKLEIEANTTSGLLAPPGTPPEIVRTLNSALNKVVNDATYKNRLTAVGSIPKGSTAQEWSNLLNLESLNSQKLSQAGKLKAE